MVRSGLRLLLEEEGDFHVVGEAGDVDAALELAGADSPDVILLDLNMPGRPSLPAIPELLEASPGGAVVVMTQHDDPEFARVALSGGASGFVLKEAAHSELVEAVRAAVAGRTYLNPSLGARLAAVPARQARRRRGAGGRLDVRGAPHRRDRRARGHGRGLPRHRHHPRPAGRAEAAGAEPGPRPGVPRALRARVPARRGARPSARRPDLPRRRRARGALPDHALHRGHRPAGAAGRGGAARAGAARSRSSPRSPTRWARRTGAGSSTATSSPPTS